MTITTTNHDDDFIATTLLNVAIIAAERRGGRRMLTIADYNAFKAMVAASDGIQAIVQPEQPQLAEQEDRPAEEVGSIGMEAVADAIGQRNATLPPNAF
jgi:hypothetical protein